MLLLVIQSWMFKWSASGIINVNLILRATFSILNNSRCPLLQRWDKMNELWNSTWELNAVQDKGICHMSHQLMSNNNYLQNNFKNRWCHSGKLKCQLKQIFRSPNIHTLIPYQNVWRIVLNIKENEYGIRRMWK